MHRVFQILFEPSLSEAVTRAPKYYEAADGELPVSESEGIRIKSIIGGQSPIKLVADARMEHWSFAANATYGLGEDPARTQAIVAVEGDFAIQNGAERRLVQARDFLVVTGKLDNVWLTAGENGGEAVLVDVPTEVCYPLLEK